MVSNPLKKIRKLKEMDFERSCLNLFDFAKMVFALCTDAGVGKEGDQVLWALACFSPEIMAKLPQDVLTFDTREKLLGALVVVTNKYDVGPKDGVNAIDARRKREEKQGSRRTSPCVLHVERLGILATSVPVRPSYRKRSRRS